VRAGEAAAPAPDGAPAAVEAPEPSPLPDRLTLRDCILRALMANKDIRVADVQADIAEAAIEGAEGEFDVTIFAEASKGQTDVPVAGVPLGRTHTSDTNVTMGVRKRIVTGTDVEVTASNAYTRDLTHTADLNPQYGPAVTVGVSQDLLKDFGVDVNRTDIVIARNNHQATVEELRDSVMANLLEVERTYWSLYYAMADLAVREQQRDRANGLVDFATKRERIGRGTEKDITRARSSAAAQSVAILNAENRVRQLRHRLLRLMGVLDERTADAEFELAEAPSGAIFKMPLADAMAVARRSRPDCRQAELAIDNAELRRRFARNQTLPTLQLFGEYSLAGLGDDLSDGTDHVRRAHYDSWQAGLRFEWPFPNRTARSDHRVARLERRAAVLLQEAVLETATGEVADALEDLHTAEGRIETARLALEFARELLDKENKAFAAGSSDSTDVLNAQGSLASAERDEVGARTDYAIALAALFRAQGDLLERKGIALIDYRMSPTAGESGP
jgi:outer membrane protein TolC